MEFNYYYGSQADQFSFIRIPKVMLTEELFSGLSIPAKVLYGVLLDRMTLSRKNAWFDEDNRVFIIYQIGEIQEDLGFSKKKAMELLAELEKFGLLEKKRRGHGLPNILYVKSFMTGFDAGKADSNGLVEGKMKARGSETGTSGAESTGSRSAAKGTSRSDGLGTSRVTDPGLLRVPVSAPLKSKTEINHTDWNNIESDQIRSAPAQGELMTQMGSDAMRLEEDLSETIAAYRNLIRENISYDNLLIAHPHDRELVDGIADLILETVISRKEYMLIASSSYPAEVVRSKFLKLQYSHIEYVLFCMERNTTKVNNIKKYLLAALFNAPSTIDGYYRAEVNHDMYGVPAGK